MTVRPANASDHTTQLERKKARRDVCHTQEVILAMTLKLTHFLLTACFYQMARCLSPSKVSLWSTSMVQFAHPLRVEMSTPSPSTYTVLKMSNTITSHLPMVIHATHTWILSHSMDAPLSTSLSYGVTSANTRTTLAFSQSFPVSSYASSVTGWSSPLCALLDSSQR